VIAEYIVKVGAATEQDAKLALSTYLLHRFVNEATFNNCACAADKEPWYLASGAVMNTVFGEIDLDYTGSATHYRKREGAEPPVAQNWIPTDTVQFATDNSRQIREEIQKLSREYKLQEILTGAAFNIGYARYIKAGGSRGIFSNQFITHVRVLANFEPELYLKTLEKIRELDPWILRPLHALYHYNLLSRLPRNPNERDYLTAVQNFAEEMSRIQIVMPERRKKEALESSLAEKGDCATDRPMEKNGIDAEYPTPEQMNEAWEAYKSGKPGAIAEVLRKRKKERQICLAASPIVQPKSPGALSDSLRIRNRAGEVIFMLESAKDTADLVRAAVKANIDLGSANLAGADLHGIDLSGANLNKATLRDSDLHGAKLYRANLDRADLYEANLRCANLSDANLHGANLHGANLRDADLHRANLEEATLGRALLYRANLRSANLREALAYEANLHEADLRKADMRDITLRGADLERANLKGADLRDADLRDANLRGADLNGSDLRGADLDGTNLDDANLSDADSLGT